MRVAVVGGTGLVGHFTVKALKDAGHEPVVVARSTGFDVTTGKGLDAALLGVLAVIDVTSTNVTDRPAARLFFETITRHLLAAEVHAGVRHHVALSIVGVDRVQGNAHYAGKRHQEELVQVGPVPFTIQRATQFHEFAGMVVGWTLKDGRAVVPPLLVQPVAAEDVGRVLAEVAVGKPLGRAPDLAGPEQQDLVDMARRTLEKRGERVKLVPSWKDSPLGVEMAGNVALPGTGARLAETTFEAWLAREGPTRANVG